MPSLTLPSTKFDLSRTHYWIGYHSLKATLQILQGFRASYNSCSYVYAESHGVRQFILTKVWSMKENRTCCKMGLTSYWQVVAETLETETAAYLYNGATGRISPPRTCPAPPGVKWNIFCRINSSQEDLDRKIYRKLPPLKSKTLFFSQKGKIRIKVLNKAPLVNQLTEFNL